MKPNWKWALVLFAWLAPIFWLWALFLFPNAWQDHEGYHQLVWLIAISGAHFLVGALLCVFAGLGVLRFRLALSVMLAPLAHYLGASEKVPWCLILFLAPLVLTLIFGVTELRDS